MANHKGSNPSLGTIGARIGTITKIIPIQSINAPSIKHTNIIIAKTAHLPPGNPRIKLSTTPPPPALKNTLTKVVEQLAIRRTGKFNCA